MDNSISRRRLGIGVGALSGAVVLGSAGAAEAAGGATHVARGVPTGLRSISSPPRAGVSYRFLDWTTLTPLNNLADGRAFQAGGVSTTANDLLGAALDLPPGARVYDVEAYVSATTNTLLSAAVWSSGVPSLGNVIASTQVGPFPSGQVEAVRMTVPAAVSGPFPHGCRLAVYIDTLASAAIQVNGFRVGFRQAPLSPVLLPTPVRVYDSRSHALTNRSRTVSLAGHVPAGANGAIVTVTAQHTVGHGSLKVYAHGSPVPAGAAVSWTSSGQVVSDQVMTAIDGKRRLTVHASGSTRLALDLAGYLV